MLITCFILYFVFTFPESYPISCGRLQCVHICLWANRLWQNISFSLENEPMKLCLMHPFLRSFLNDILPSWKSLEYPLHLDNFVSPWQEFFFYAVNESCNSAQVQTQFEGEMIFFSLTFLNYTMIGDKELKSPGIAPRAMTAIFSLMNEQKWVWIIFVE